MKAKKLIIILFSFFCLGILEAKNTNPEPTTKNPEEVFSQKDNWSNIMRKKLPHSLCKENSYFVKCYKVNKNECLALTKWTLNACLNNIIDDLPEKITPLEGEKWGKLTALCTLDIYKNLMKNKKENNFECSNTNSEQDKS